MKAAQAIALMPPIEAMEDFVEKVGLEKFAYIPGYSSIDVSNIKDAAKRVAWAVAMSRKRVPTVRRKSRSAWYNSTKSNFLNVMRGRMLDRAQGIVLKAMKEAVT